MSEKTTKTPKPKIVSVTPDGVKALNDWQRFAASVGFKVETIDIDSDGAIRGARVSDGDQKEFLSPNMRQRLESRAGMAAGSD